MAASLNDQAILAADVLFQNRVREGLITACANIWNEATSAAYHFARVRLVVQIMNSIEAVSGNASVWVLRFAAAVATDTSVIADATSAGTVALTSANVDQLQASVTDAHINTAISAQFNTFFYPA